MRTIEFNVSEAGCQETPVFIGYQGENEVTRVIVDYSAWVEEFGPGALSLEVMRAGDTAPYLAPLTVEDEQTVWVVSNVDTGARGEGAAGFVFTVDEQVKKSAVFRFFVGRDVGGTPGDRPDPYESLITYMEKLVAQTEENATNAAESASASDVQARTAEQHAQAAGRAQQSAETAQDAAETAQTAAEAARDAAASSATAAAGSATTATAQAQAAATARTAAETAQGAAETAQTAAEAARDAAAASATAAAGSATTAAQQAQAAATAKSAAETAQGAAETAQTAAEAARDAAAASATAAAGSATTATQQAQAAATARSAAEAAQQAAETAQGAAETARDAAASSATDAAGSATTATQQAQAAATARTAAETAQQAAETAKGAAETAQQAIEDLTVSAEEIDTAQPTVEKQVDPQTGAVNLNFGFAKNQATTATTLGPAPIVTFDASAADMPLKGLTVNVEPVQAGEGDPSPENVRPITGWTSAKIYAMGRNLVQDPDYVDRTVNGVSYTKNIDGSYSANGTLTGGSECFLLRWTTNKLYKPGNYELSCLGDVSGYGIRFVCAYRQNPSASLRYREIISSGQKLTFTIEDGGYINALYFRGQTSGTAVNTTLYPMLQLAEDAEANYTSHDGTIYNIAFPAEAGTVYGGTLDAVNGKLTVDRAIAILNGSENWQMQSTYQYGFYYDNAMPGAATGMVEGDARFACNKYKVSKSIINSSGLPDKENVTVFNQSNIVDWYKRAWVKDTSYTGDLAGFKASLAANNLQIVYPLASPITYQLTARQITTLLGTNNIWADCGDVTVTYGAYLETVKAHAERLGDSILSAIAPLEANYTASRDYAIGSYLFVGTKFYKITAAIAEGGTITPGTNAVQTTVAEQLIALAAG